MLSAHTPRATTTTLQPGQSWFKQSKTGKNITPSPPTVVKVVTRVVRPTPAPLARLLAPSFSASSSVTSSSRASSVSDSATTTERKRKRSEEAPGPSSSKSTKRQRSSSSAQAIEHAKKPRGASTTTRSKGKSVLNVPPDVVYRKSRSRSVTAFEHADVPRERKTWTDEDGAVDEQLVSCEQVIKKLMPKYKAFFRNLENPEDTSFEPHLTDPPTVWLEYPNDKAAEQFVLLEPKDKDHYNPIMCLEQTLHTIISYYLTPAQKTLFGTLPEESLITATTARSAPNSTASSSSLSSLSSSSSSLTSLSSDSLSTLSSIPSTSSSSTSTNLLRSLNRAIHLRDGPKFLSTMSRINELLRSLKNPADNSPNPLRQIPRSWSATGIPPRVLLRIIEETYQRTIGPNIMKLKDYKSFTSEVYGELMPTFISDIISATGLNETSLFLDLGSGVGNVVLQASLQTGCRSFGVEKNPNPAKLATEQLQQLKLRCRMWGVAVGGVELAEADMKTCPQVDELMKEADVVLVNNFVFEQELNEAMRPKFLDLKEGARLVSLKPFAPPSNQRLNERNIDDISAIFEVETRPYHSGTVSWSGNDGVWYLHRVDREGYSDCRTAYERSRMGRRRGRRQGRDNDGLL